MKAKDLTGKRFGRLVVIERAGRYSDGHAAWLCRCDCGTEKAVNANFLSKGETMSCGCLNREVNGSKAKIHGMTGTRLYREWQGMKRRCYSESNPAYPNYGGRGITVCPEWLESFEAFRAWAMENGYRDDLTLDRKQNDGPYSPENCRWITFKAQQNNKRSNRLITYNGKTQTLAMWADEMNIPYNTLRLRISNGWSLDKALNKPVRKKRAVSCNEQGS